MSKPPGLQIHGRMIVCLPLVQVRMLIMCAENVHHSFLSMNIYNLNTASLQRLLVPRLPCLTVCSSSGLLVQVYTIPPPLCPAAYTEYAEVLGCFISSRQELRLLDPTFMIVCLCTPPSHSSFPSSHPGQIQVPEHDSAQN